MEVLYASGFEMGTNEYVFDGWFNTASMALNTTPANLHLIDGLGGASCVLINSYAELVVQGTGRFLHLGYRSKLAVPTNYQYIQFKSPHGIEFTIRFETTGLIVLRRGGETGTVVATSALSIDYTQYHWIVVEMVVDNTTGLCTVKVDGVEMVTFSGDTKGTIAALELPWQQIRFLAGGSIGMYLDDVIITDAALGEIPECCGVLHVPDGPGDSAEWTPLGGSNWENVDDPTSTATYVDADAAGLDDLYTVNYPCPIGSVAFVKLSVVASSQGGQDTKLLLKAGATVSESTAALQGSPNAFKLIHDYWLDSPDTSNPFTKGEIKALQIGLRT